MINKKINALGKFTALAGLLLGGFVGQSFAQHGAMVMIEEGEASALVHIRSEIEKMLSDEATAAAFSSHFDVHADVHVGFLVSPDSKSLDLTNADLSQLAKTANLQLTNLRTQARKIVSGGGEVNSTQQINLVLVCASAAKCKSFEANYIGTTEMRTERGYQHLKPFYILADFGTKKIVPVRQFIPDGDRLFPPKPWN